MPSMDQMREAYGAQLPANDMVNRYLPLVIRVTQGKSKTMSQCYPANSIQEFAAAFWDGKGVPRDF